VIPAGALITSYPIQRCIHHTYFADSIIQVSYSITKIPREKVPHVVKFALNKMCPQDYITSFRRAGIRPLNRSVILEDGKQRLRSRKAVCAKNILTN
jgi:hypothetical protein